MSCSSLCSFALAMHSNLKHLKSSSWIMPQPMFNGFSVFHCRKNPLSLSKRWKMAFSSSSVSKFPVRGSPSVEAFRGRPPFLPFSWFACALFMYDCLQWSMYGLPELNITRVTKSAFSGSVPSSAYRASISRHRHALASSSAATSRKFCNIGCSNTRLKFEVPICFALLSFCLSLIPFALPFALSVNFRH